MDRMWVFRGLGVLGIIKFEKPCTVTPRDIGRVQWDPKILTEQN